MSLTGPLVRHFSRRVSGSQRQQKANPSTSLAVERAIIDTFSRFGGSSVVIVLRRRHAPPHFHRFHLHTSHQLLCCHLPASGHAPPSKAPASGSKTIHASPVRLWREICPNPTLAYTRWWSCAPCPRDPGRYDPDRVWWSNGFFSLEMGSRMFSRRFPSAV